MIPDFKKQAKKIQGGGGLFLGFTTRDREGFCPDFRTPKIYCMQKKFNNSAIFFCKYPI